MAGKHTLALSILPALTFMLCLLYGVIYNTISTHSGIAVRVYPMMKKNICIHIEGRLGNSLFRVAALYVLALQTDRVPSACAKNPINGLFENVSISTNKCRNNICLQKGTRIGISGTKSILYRQDLAKRINAISDGNVRIFGGFRNLRYFSGYTDSIKAMYQICKVYREKAQKYLHSLAKVIAKETKKKLTTNKEGKVLFNQKLPVFVAVHVRRTDILKATYSNTPGHLYYENAMSYMRQRHGSEVVFVVVTDDPTWSKANLKGNDVYFTAEKHMMSKQEDFAIAVACNHTVMSVGTFGWWISFLSGGDVVYFKDWTKGWFEKHYRPKEIFPEHWTPMGE